MAETQPKSRHTAMDWRGRWYALPQGRGSAVGPFWAHQEALDWLDGDGAARRTEGKETDDG